MEAKTKKFQIGDVVRLKDGIDYNGNSLSYQVGITTEILGYEKDRYRVQNFYRVVEEDEIEKLVMTNAEKCEKYRGRLSLYNQIVVIRKDSLTFEEVTIRYYSFEYKDFMYIDENEHHYQVGRFWLTLLDAYKMCYEEIISRMLEIHKTSGYCRLTDDY